MWRTLTALLFFALAGFCFWILLQLLIIFFDFDLLNFFKSLPFLYPTAVSISEEVALRSASGITYFFIFASLFFLPVPLELAYINFIHEGILPANLLLFATFGILLGQIINFFLGKLFGPIFRSFIKKKTRKWVHEKLQQYGIIAIFLMNFLPMPFPLFNFVAGLMKYPFWRWLLVIIPALFFKHALMNLFF